MGSVMPAFCRASRMRPLRPHWFHVRTGRGTFLPPHLQQVTVCITVFVDRKARRNFACRASQLRANV